MTNHLLSLTIPSPKSLVKLALTLTLFLFSRAEVTAQLSDTLKILNEGKLLFRLEKASWYGTDYLMANSPSLRDSLGGYLSYSKGNKVYTIFYSRYNKYHIFTRYTFDSIPQVSPVNIDNSHHAPDNFERDLITIRQDAIEKFRTDTFFRNYKNTSPNPIPLITNNQKKVYIIMGTHSNGVVLIGNDYCLEYDSNNNFKNKQRLHNSLIALPTRSSDNNKPTQATVHSHVLSELITPTDICTLLLYRHLTQWKIHYVVGRKYVSIFDMNNETLKVVPFEEFKKTLK